MLVKTRDALDHRTACAIIAQSGLSRLVANPSPA
jgi:hypothetical protein